jgi:nucleoside-diphosphate-sugar epimerase
MIGSNLVRLFDYSCECADIKEGIDLRLPWKHKKMDVIYDCAAPTQGIGSDDFMDAARIPLTMLATKPAIYVYASSSCVYPEHTPLPADEEWGLIGEPEEANRGYGWAKRVGELACKYSGVPCTIVRLANIYGPSYDWKKPHKHVIPSLIEKMLRGDNPLIVWGSGHQTRSFMYETDCAERMIALSTHPGTYNLGGYEVSIRDIVHFLVGIIGYKGKIFYDETKPVGPLRKSQSTEKMDQTIGALPVTPLRKGLELTVERAIDQARNHRTRAHTQ